MSGPGQEGSLQVSNRMVINSLSTKAVSNCRDNLWVICGAAVDCPGTYRMVNASAAFMPSGQVNRRPFY